MPGEKVPPITLKGKLIEFNSPDAGDEIDFNVRDVILTGTPNTVSTDHLKVAA